MGAEGHADGTVGKALDVLDMVAQKSIKRVRTFLGLTFLALSESL